MRVLQLGKFYPIGGGVEKVMYDLMAGLSARGVSCDMLCAAVKGGGCTINLNDYAKLFSCRTWKEIAGTMIAPSIITRLWSICKKYDIIHVHHPDPMACLALFLSGFKGKVVLHWHSDIVKQKTLLKAYKPLQAWLLKRADLILGTTPIYVKESPYLRYHQKKCAWLPIGIDQVSYDVEGAKKIKDLYPGKKIIFAVGRLVHYKGFRHLVEAASYLPDDYVVLIGGRGPLHETLSTQIQNLGVSDKVKLLGYIREEDFASYYKACDLFCLSSIWKTEAFAIVQVEAMSCGKPIVATRIPESGVSWVNKHGYSGLNVPVEDAKALADAILELTSDREVYERYSSQSRQHYENNFTYAGMIDKCLHMYDEILNR